MTEIIAKIIQCQEQVRIMHWQTTSYARHMAFGMFYDGVTPLLDALVESYQGTHGRIDFSNVSFEVRSTNEVDLNVLLGEVRTCLCAEFKQHVSEADTDILNIRDELLALVNKLNYLLTLS